MQLHKGTSITPQEKKNLLCNTKWNAVRKSYADFFGLKYVIPPVYSMINNKTVKKGGTRKNKTRKQKL
jgi:hypothetical protein